MSATNLPPRALPCPFQRGVNFTNWLEFKRMEQVKPDYFTRQDFENAKSLGCDVVRLPIHFELLCGPAPEYIVPEELWGILDRVAKWAEELKLYVIFDFHNATHAESFTPPDVEKLLIPVWRQLAARYRDASPYLVYEILNEPHAIDQALWEEIQRRVFCAIRSLDKNHYIIVGGADYNSAAAMLKLGRIEDDKIIYTFHCYDPHTFTHQGASWCHMERVRGIPFPYDEKQMPPLPENATELERQRFEAYPRVGTVEAVSLNFDSYAQFSQRIGAPVFCGEMGCAAIAVDTHQRAVWYRLIAALLDEREIPRASWDYYGMFGLFKIGPRVPGGWKRPAFPEDLEPEIVEALGLTMPGGKD